MGLTAPGAPTSSTAGKGKPRNSYDITTADGSRRVLVIGTQVLETTVPYQGLQKGYFDGQCMGKVHTSAAKEINRAGLKQTDGRPLFDPEIGPVQVGKIFASLLIDAERNHHAQAPNGSSVDAGNQEIAALLQRIWQAKSAADHAREVLNQS